MTPEKRAEMAKIAADTGRPEILVMKERMLRRKILWMCWPWEQTEISVFYEIEEYWDNSHEQINDIIDTLIDEGLLMPSMIDIGEPIRGKRLFQTLRTVGNPATYNL